MRYHIKIKFIQCLLVLLMCLASLSLYGEVWDRGIIFFIGPDIDGGNSAMASFAKKIDRKNILKNHFGAQNISKVFTINGYMPDIKPGRLNKYKKLVIYITLHGFKRGGEKELYIVKGKAAQRDINDFRSDPNRKSLPNGVTQFSSFIEDIRANIDRKSSNTLYIFEICSLLSRAKRGGEGLKESMSENLEDFANENYAASVGDLVPDCDKDMLEDLQNALDRRTTSGVKSISIKDLQTIFPSGCVKVNMVRDMILNPRVLCFYKDVGDKKEYLNEIDLGNGVSDLNRPLSLTINGNSIEILKVSDTTYHIKKDGKNTEKEDYANRTYALFNIQEISGYSLSFESQYPDQVLPKTGAHKVRKGQKVRFQAYDRGNIKFLYFLVNGKRDHIEKKGNMYELEIEINGDTHVTAEFGRKKEVPTPTPSPTATSGRSPTPTPTPTPQGPVSIHPGSREQRASLAKFLYYVDAENFVLHRVDTTIGNAIKLPNIRFAAWGDVLLFNTALHADENHTGNRFITFYKQDISDSEDTSGFENASGFMVYDKLMNTLDRDTFIKKETKKNKLVTLVIYPADYLDRDKKTCAQFVRIACDKYSENGGYYVERIYRDQGRNVIREFKAMDKDIRSYFYNAMERVLTWVEETGTNKMKIIKYDIPRNRKEELTIVRPSAFTPTIWMAGFGFTGIQLSNPDTNRQINVIYQMDTRKPEVKRFDNSQLCCYVQRGGNLHLFVSSGSTMNYLYFDAESDEQTLDEIKLSSQWNSFATQKEVKRLFLLNQFDNYFLCVWSMDAQKNSSFKLHRLNDNFSKLMEIPSLFLLPKKFREAGVLDIHAEEGKMLVKTLRGKILCVGLVDKEGKLSFKYLQKSMEKQK